jgi:hypothetical protein
MAAVWRYFAEAGPLLGREWPISYRSEESVRIAVLRGLGVRRFAALLYAHKPDMAHFLTQWSLGFAERVPDAVPSGTFFPEPGVVGYVTDAITAGCQIFKIHLQVSAFDPRDRILDEVWGLLAEAGIPVVVHAGSGPVPGKFTGPGPFGEVQGRHPRLRSIIAHMGMPQEREFTDLALRYESVCLDTTMVGTDFLEAMHRMPRDLMPVVRDLGLAGRVVFGSDFPNIPYNYAHQIEALSRWGLGADWLAAVLWHNGDRLLRAR